jgi:hypothetical protein
MKARAREDRVAPCESLAALLTRADIVIVIPGFAAI